MVTTNGYSVILDSGEECQVIVNISNYISYKEMIPLNRGDLQYVKLFMSMSTIKYFLFNNLIGSM